MSKKKKKTMHVVVPIQLNVYIDVEASSRREAYHKAWDEIRESINKAFNSPTKSYECLEEDYFIYAKVDGREVDLSGKLADGAEDGDKDD